MTPSLTTNQPIKYSTTLGFKQWNEAIAKKKQDFVGKIEECNLILKGFTEKSRIKKKGTGKFQLEVDRRTIYNLLIHNRLYAPDAP